MDRNQQVRERYAQLLQSGKMTKEMQAMQHPLMAAKLQSNPVPPGVQGLTVMRGLSSCSIPREAKLLNDITTAYIQQTPTENDDLTNALSKGVTIAISANQHCMKNMHKRVAYNMSNDEELSKMHQDLSGIKQKLEALKAEYESLMENANTLFTERWTTACKKGGLSPENNFYQIDENTGEILEVELRCDLCEGAKEITQARETASNLLNKGAEK